MQLQSQEMSGLLDLTGEVWAARGLGDVQTLLAQGLPRLVPCEFAGCHRIDTGARQVNAAYEPQRSSLPCHHHDFLSVVRGHPLQPRLLQQPGSAWQNTDVLSQTQFQRTAFFDLFYRPLGIDHELTSLFPLPGGESRHLVVSLHRRRRLFSERDRLVMNLVMPQVERACKKLQDTPTPIARDVTLEWFRARVLEQPTWSLNPREVEVLFWILQGKSNTEIGMLLGISPRTAETHALRAYPKMGVENRYAAIVTLMELVRADQVMCAPCVST